MTSMTSEAHPIAPYKAVTVWRSPASATSYAGYRDARFPDSRTPRGAGLGAAPSRQDAILEGHSNVRRDRERTSDILANHKNTLKAHKQDLVRRTRNRGMRTRLRRALRSLRAAIDQGKTDEVQAVLSGTVSLIDKMSAKGIIHDNTAARYKSRLAKRFTTAAASAS